MKTNLKFILLFLFMAILSVSTVYFLKQKRNEDSIILADQPTGGDFTLQSVDGPIDLKNFRGKFVFLYFGYTFCPDICPTSLAALTAALNKLNVQELNRVEIFFISVDPERDTAQRLKEYSAFFHPKIKGLTGSAEELRNAIKLYGGAYKINSPKEGSSHYTVDHSADIYLIGPDGTWIDTIKHGTSALEIYNKLLEQFTKSELKK